MTVAPFILSGLVALGGAGGLVALLRLRTDKGATVVETVSKSVLVLERLNTLLEADLRQERELRVAAEAERDRLAALLRERR